METLYYLKLRDGSFCLLPKNEQEIVAQYVSYASAQRVWRTFMKNNEEHIKLIVGQYYRGNIVAEECVEYTDVAIARAAEFWGSDNYLKELNEL